MTEYDESGTNLGTSPVTASWDEFEDDEIDDEIEVDGDPVQPPISLAQQIEAILYLKGRPLSIARIAEYAQCDREDIEDGLIELMTDYAHRNSALEVVETPEGYALQLRTAFQDLVQTLVPLDLGLGALRTLAAIALKGPLSQTDLIELRGSGAYQHVHELVDLGFVQKRRMSKQRSSWLQVTDKFHQYFAIDALPQTFIQPEEDAAIADPDTAETPELDDGADAPE